MQLFDDPRVQELLEQIEGVSNPLDRDELERLFRKLGKRVHAIWLGDPQSFGAADLAWRVPAWDDLPDLPEQDDHTEIPDPASFQRHLTPADEPVPGELTRLEDLQGQQGTGALATLRGSSLPWREALDDLLDLIVLPPDLRDPAAMPTEASKVQWGSGELGGRISRFPEPVQQALLALLAARARNLATYLDVDIGPRMALDRLKRVRASQDLPWVVGLTPNAQPETDSWANDARAFWTLLGR